MTDPANSDAALVRRDEIIAEFWARVDDVKLDKALEEMAAALAAAAERADELEVEAEKWGAVAQDAEAALLAAQQERDKEHRDMDFYRRMAIDEKLRAERAEAALATAEQLANAYCKRANQAEAKFAEANAECIALHNQNVRAEATITRLRETLKAIRDLPSEHDLLTNAMARALYEIAIRRLAQDAEQAK